MTTRIPEANKKPGLCYAWSEDGVELPVIDVTHPAFAYEPSQEEVSRLIEEAIVNIERAMKAPPAEARAMADTSILMRLWMQARGNILSGMGTYLSKLGPDNLGEGWAGPLDRRIVGGLTPSSFRLRLPRMARLIADGLGVRLAIDGNRPVRLVNIAGGPAADSFNALILLQREHPEWLAGRRISIRVLDLDRVGPDFGARAVAALASEGGPLQGIDVTFDWVEYDWTRPTSLHEALDAFREEDAIVAGSSEGGLFLYASELEIEANLRTFREYTPADAFIVASLSRDTTTMDPRLRSMTNVPGAPAIRHLGFDAFGELAARTGWTVAQRLDDPFVHNATLIKETV